MNATFHCWSATGFRRNDQGHVFSTTFPSKPTVQRGPHSRRPSDLSRHRCIQPGRWPASVQGQRQVQPFA
eukprot:139575-Lingulodinium_polyedra.AAC.1